MASEKIRTGMELELYVMGQCSKRLGALSAAAKVRTLTHLMESARDEESADNAQTEMFGAKPEG